MERDYHEVIGDIIKIDTRPQDIQKASSYLHKMNYISEEMCGIEPDLVNLEEKKSTITLKGENLEKAISGVDYNYSTQEDKLSILKEQAIKDKDYMSIFEWLRETYPYSQIDDYILYQHARHIVGKPMTLTEKYKVRADLNSIKKFWKKENKKMKKKSGQYNITF